MGFVMGKAKLAPLPEHAVLRLEFCAAVLAVVAELISSEIDMELDDTTFYSDTSIMILDVSMFTSVLWIRSYSRPEQWQYAPTDVNPADIATRSVAAANLSGTNWLHGLAFLTLAQQSPTFLSNLSFFQLTYCSKTSL